MPDFNPNLLQRTSMKLASTKLVAKIVSPFLHHVDRTVANLTGNRHSALSLVSGLPFVILTATGAKSGEPREVPLIGTPIGEEVVLIASNWGGKKHPSWYYNLKATPACTLTYDGKTDPYIAREVSGEEKTQVWQQAVALYPGYEAYKSRTGGREIPVFVLTPDT
jgi:deazaflavin-dependent oxidoreductase (nitroreductase family)